MTLGNVVSNVLAGLGGAVVGGGMGAFTASNGDLYNRSTGNAEGAGGTGSQFIDKVSGWLADTYGHPVDDVVRWAGQFGSQAAADAGAKSAQAPSDLVAQGVANGLNAVVGTGGAKPPAASPGVVLVDSTAANAVPGTAGSLVPGYGAGNATFNSGNGGNESAGDASSDVNLASPDRTTHILTGDSTGGGHQWPGGPGKSAFPESWSASKIMDAVSDIATNPAIPETVQANGRIVKNGSVDGIDIRVVIEPASKGGEIVTAFPTNVPKNPK